MQLTHNTHTTRPNTKALILLCDSVSSPANQGALFRLADAFGVEEIIFCGTTPDLSSSRLKKMARNTHTHIPFRLGNTSQEEVIQLHKEGYTSIALEITSNSSPLASLRTASLDKVVLIIGAEVQGISEGLLEESQHTVHIPMHGVNSSMNVAQAAAIALYVISNS